MPYSSRAQQRFMHVQHPNIAARWDKETKKAGGFKKLPEHVMKSAMKKKARLKPQEKKKK